MKKKIITLIVAVLILFGGYKFAYPYLPHDIEYKKELLKSSGHPEYTLKNMKPIMV